MSCILARCDSRKHTGDVFGCSLNEQDAPDRAAKSDWFDFGVMPLNNDPWSRGKCAVKLLEYMSMKLAAVSSAVGENRYVVDNGYNGLLTSSRPECTDDIESLIVDLICERS